MKGINHIKTTLVVMGMGSYSIFRKTSMIAAVLIVLGGILGSVLPDADTKNSIAGKWLPLYLFFRHRGFTHTIFALMIACILTSFVSTWLAVGLGIGYGLHILADVVGTKLKRGF